MALPYSTQPFDLVCNGSQYRKVTEKFGGVGFHFIIAVKQFGVWGISTELKLENLVGWNSATALPPNGAKWKSTIIEILMNWWQPEIHHTEFQFYQIDSGYGVVRALMGRYGRPPDRQDGPARTAAGPNRYKPAAVTGDGGSPSAGHPEGHRSATLLLCSVVTQ